MDIFATIVLIGTAFVVLPFGTSWYEIPKVLIALTSISLLTIPFFWRQASWSKIKLSKSTWALYIGLFLLSLSGLYTKWTPTTFFGNPFRLQGIFPLWQLLIWSLIAPPLIHIKKLNVFAFVALIMMTIVTYVGQTDSAGRAVGAVGEANSLGAYSAFLVPLSQSVFALAPALGIILLSGSRSALIGLTIGSIIWFGSKRFSFRILVLFSSLLLLISCFLPLFDTKQTNDYRADIWKTAIRAGKEKPITGWGIGNIEIGLKAAANSEQTFLRYQYVDSSHNIFLDWWVQGGVIGLGLFSLMVWKAIDGLIREKNSTLLASFFALFSVMLFNPVSIALLIPFWWMIGHGLSTEKKPKLPRK